MIAGLPARRSRRPTETAWQRRSRRGLRAGRRHGKVVPLSILDCSPLSPVLRGEGSGVRGFRSPLEFSPSPQPLSPEYRGEGLPSPPPKSGGAPQEASPGTWDALSSPSLQLLVFGGVARPENPGPQAGVGALNEATNTGAKAGNRRAKKTKQDRRWGIGAPHSAAEPGERHPTDIG